MDLEPDSPNPDRYEAFNRLTPRSAALGFELQAARSQHLGAVEQIGEGLTLEQSHFLQVDLQSAQIEAIFRAFNQLEQDIVKIRHGVTDEDLPDPN